MDIFLTGASGFVGGSVAVRLLSDGHRIRGLVRNPAKADGLRQLGIEPVIGELDDADLLAREARRAGAVVNAADSDHRGAVEALLAGIDGSGKPLLHTSGSSIVADAARGEPSELVFDEDTLPEPAPEKAARVAIDRLVLAAAGRNIRSVVLCNTLIYGSGYGLHQESIQIPALVREARRSGMPRHVGRGLNVWSTVHIDDVVDAYALALAAAPAGSFFFLENGETSFREIAGAIGDALRLGPPRPWPVEDAIRELGYARAVFSLGSNCRVRGRRTRKVLGWKPDHASVLDWTRQEYATG
jgi:nucleoside-diphosphate-sugar epimerase